MLACSVTISNRLGMHARAAAKLVQAANAYRSEIHLEKDGTRVNAKNIIEVMMLAAAKGERVTIQAHGSDEQQALNKLTALIGRKFEEEGKRS